MEEEKKRRTPRTTKKQIEIIVSYLESHSILLKLKVEPQEYDLLRESWVGLAYELNTCNMGPSKSITQWKQVVSELKTNTKKKARDIFLKKKGTGGGPPVKDLTDIEEKLYNLLSSTYVEGGPDIPEIGIPEETSDRNENENNLPSDPENVPSSKPTSTRFKVKRTRSRSTKKSLLAKSIEHQMKATSELAEAIVVLSGAIQNLAESINTISMSINGFADEISN